MKVIALYVLQLSFILSTHYFYSLNAIPTSRIRSLESPDANPRIRRSFWKREADLNSILSQQPLDATQALNLTELLTSNNGNILLGRDLLASDPNPRGYSFDLDSTLNRRWAFQNVKQHIDEHYEEKGYGTWVVDRKTGYYFWEYVPTLTAVGMHLAFNSSRFTPKLLRPMFKVFTSYSKLIPYDLLGTQYERKDQPYVINHIRGFIQEFGINTSELLQRNLHAYPTFNSFFARKLIPGARPIDSPNDPSVLTSPADCRCVVFQSVKEAQEIWIKGKGFSIAALLGVTPEVARAQYGAQPDIAVFRLAPQDYHRFHSPMNARLGARKRLGNTYYTVNPTAVKEDLDVFVGNRRVVQILDDTENHMRFAFIAVGALLVGSMQWSQEVDSTVHKGDDLGWFQFGGSTVILIAPESKVAWDADLVKNSLNGTETLIRVGNHIGLITAEAV